MSARRRFSPGSEEDDDYLPSDAAEEIEIEIEEEEDDSDLETGELVIGDDDEGPTTDAPVPAPDGSISANQLLQQLLAGGNNSISPGILAFLRTSGGRFILGGRRYQDDDDDDDESMASQGTPTSWFKEPSKATERGLELLWSGEFGRVESLEHDLRVKARKAKPSNIGWQLRHTRARPRYAVREDLARSLVPDTCGTIVAQYHANPYSGQYSADSSFFYTCCQDFRLHIYDTTAPPNMRGSMMSVREDQDHTTTMTSKTINAVPASWTITDSHLSPDNDRMIYASMNSKIYMTSTRDDSPRQIPLDFRNPRADSSNIGFRLLACRFSADGNEIVAGGTQSIFVYDLLAMRRTVQIEAHGEDVNSVCWADSSSGNVLVSASDDTFLKVWDRRSLGAEAKPAGVLVGHTEGITYVSPKGDGRYVISNGKDQTMRLWDLRKMRSHTEWEAMPHREYGLPNRNGYSWDYRSDWYRPPRYDAHPSDCSVMAYRGHHVLRTLIRCHFSPAETTGSSYLYTGSSDGRIHIYSLDGSIVQVLDRSKALPMSFDPSEPEALVEERTQQGRRRRSGVVRDVAWHSQEPVLMSVAWGSGSMSGGSVARHEWKGLGKNGMKLEDVVLRDKEELTTRPNPNSPIMGNGPSDTLPGGYPGDID